MKNTKKKLCLALAALVALTSFTACGDKKGNKTADGKTKLTYVSSTTGPVKDDSLVEKELEKHFTDLDIEFLPLERETYQQQLNTRIAGGDIPDIIYREWYSVVQEFAEQGIIQEVSYDNVKKWAPQFVEESMDYGADVWLACYYDGKNYGLPFMQPNQNYPTTSTWRTDWLKNVGITKIPETLEEYHEAFKRFTFNDPDKNGKKDTYGLTGTGKSNFPFNSIMYAFGVGYFEEDGTLISDEEYSKRERKAIETLASWYKEGIIDPEFVTTDGATLKQKWSNSQIGFYNDGTWYRMMPGGEHYEALKTITPNAEFEMGPAPTGTDGYHSYGAKQEGSGAITSSITFSSQLDEETLEKAVKFIAELSSNEELFTMAKYGKEGEHYKRTEDGLIQPVEPYNLQTNCGELGVNMFNVVFYPLPSVQEKMNVKNIDEYTKYAKEANIYQWPSWVEIFYGSADDMVTDTGEFNITTWYTNFVTGKMEINDKTWKEFKDASVKQGKKDKVREIKTRIFNDEYPKIEAIINNLK